MVRVPRRREFVRGILAASLLAGAASNGLAAPDNPFLTLAGYWKGDGTVAAAGGQQEKVICRVTYKVDGSTVSQNMNCAGTDYKISTVSTLTYENGRISGSWSEVIHDANGGVTGVAKGNTIHANISGEKFSGRMSISIDGSSHTVHLAQVDKKGVYHPVAIVSLRR